MVAGPGSLDKLHCGSSTHLLKGKVGRQKAKYEVEILCELM